MPDILTTLTSYAVSIFRERDEARRTLPEWFGVFGSEDPILQEAQRSTFLLPARQQSLNELLSPIFAEPDLSAIAPREGELDPMLMHPGGGFRTAPAQLVTSLFSSAFLQMYFLRLPYEEGTFVRTVLEGFEELRRAIRGERIRAYTVTGLARITLPEGSQISTPWGIIRPAPPSKAEPGFIRLNQLKTDCILAEPRLSPVRFDRAPSPTSSFEATDLAPSRSSDLLPLACALASNDTSKPVAPRITWSTNLLPFQAGFSYSWPLLPVTHGAEANLSDRAAEIEEWARIVDRAHSASIDIAVKRLVSAISHRLDRSDALIDAVMVWENLLGTSSEVTFRVSAALAKLLERDPEKRRSLRKQLSEIYGIRSRLVHGAPIDDAILRKACTEAIDVAVKALRASYNKGRDWLSLSSNERSDTILLEWQ